MPLPDSIKFENREFAFRNFAGRETQFKPEGYREFGLRLTVEEAELMLADGWNVKFKKQENPEYDEQKPYLAIALSIKFRPSRVVLLTARGRTTLTEDLYQFVDWVDVAYIDLVIRPYEWSMRGQSGVKAYLQTIYVRVRDDELDMKYQDVPEVTMNGEQLALEGSDPNVIDYDGPVYEQDVQELGR